MIRSSVRFAVLAAVLGAAAAAGCDTKAGKGTTAPKLSGSPAEMKIGEMGGPTGGLQSAPPQAGK